MSPERGLSDSAEVTPPLGPPDLDDIVTGFLHGWFPVDDHSGLHWETADPRGVLFPTRLHVPRRMRRTLIHSRLETRVDDSFDEVLAGCATSHPASRRVWLTAPVAEIYRAMFAAGLATCIAVIGDGGLVGGAFGIRIGRLCSIDSGFHHVSGAGNAAVVAALRNAAQTGAELCDVQRPSPHMLRFGGATISLAAYRSLLAELGAR